MGRRALIIALAAFAVIALGAVIVWAIITVAGPGSPTVSPTPEPTIPVVTPEPTPTPTREPTETPTPEPTVAPSDPAPAAVTALAAKPAPHSVKVAWKNPSDPDLDKLIVVRVKGSTPPATISDGKTVQTLSAVSESMTDTSSKLEPGTTYTYAVFAKDAAGHTSKPASVKVKLPFALTITAVDVTGEVTQQAFDGELTDSGSIAFTAFTQKGPRVAVALPAKGVSGKVTKALTEPKGSAPGAVAWTYKVQNSALVSLGEGAKRDEEFVLELRDGSDKFPTPITITLHGINDAPIASGIPGQSAFVGDSFAFPVPPGAFSDPDATDTLTQSTGSLPGWLSFDATTGFSGSPSAGDVGSVTVTVTATDPFGLSVSQDFTIDVVEASNVPPAPDADSVTFDLGVDPLQTDAALLGNDSDPDGGPNALAAIPASGTWIVGAATAGSFTIDAAGALHLDSGVDAAGPLQLLAPGEQATATIPYSVTDGADTVASQIDVTVIGSATKAGEYDVMKVFSPFASVETDPSPELGRGLGRGIG
jgi:VCBS repeat-containing protein